MNGSTGIATIVVHVASNGTSWSTVALAALGIVGTAAGAIFGVRFTQHGEDRRWNAAQKAIANRAEAERLRKIYSRMVEAVSIVQATISQRNRSLGGETIEERDSRHTAQINRAMEDVAR